MRAGGKSGRRPGTAVPASCLLCAGSKNDRRGGGRHAAVSQTIPHTFTPIQPTALLHVPHASLRKCTQRAVCFWMKQACNQSRQGRDVHCAAGGPHVSTVGMQQGGGQEGHACCLQSVLQSLLLGPNARQGSTPKSGSGAWRVWRMWRQNGMCLAQFSQHFCHHSGSKQGATGWLHPRRLQPRRRVPLLAWLGSEADMTSHWAPDAPIIRPSNRRFISLKASPWSHQ